MRAVTGVPGSGERARESLRQVIAAGVAYEVRTTVHPALLDAAAIETLATTSRTWACSTMPCRLSGGGLQ